VPEFRGEADKAIKWLSLFEGMAIGHMLLPCHAFKIAMDRLKDGANSWLQMLAPSLLALPDDARLPTFLAEFRR
jgi:hypothetical protein